MFSFIPFTPGVLIKLTIILSSGYNNSNFSHFPGLNCTGITGLSVDPKDRTRMTVIGDNFDAISAGMKLKRLCDTRLVSLESIKEHEGEHHKAEADKANKRKKDKLPFTILSRMCISDK